MSAHNSSLSTPPAISGAPRTRPPVVLTFGVPLVAMAAAGVGCWWALGRAAEQDRRLVLGAGALVAVLLGTAIALAMSRRRLSTELRQRVTALHAEAAITVAEHADTARRAALDLEAAQRRVRIAAGRAQVGDGAGGGT
jgi:hypothetical protein